jgi:hypothetical protein
MGFRESVKQRAEEKANTFGQVRLYGGKVFNEKTSEGGWVKGAQATVETSGQLEKRVTVTRLVTLNILAFGLRKKKDSRQLFLTVEGEDFAFVVEVDPKRERQAREFAAKINTAARQG